MALQYLAFDLGESRFDRCDLVQDIDAIAILLDHSGNTVHLSRNAVQTTDLGIADFRHGPPVEIPYGGIYRLKTPCTQDDLS